VPCSGFSVSGLGSKRGYPGVASTLKLEVRRQAKLYSRIRWRPLAEGGSAWGRRPRGQRSRALENRAVRWVLES